MFKYVLLLAIALFGVGCTAQALDKPPRFEDYPVEVYSGKRITPEELRQKWLEAVHSKDPVFSKTYEEYDVGEGEDRLKGNDKINFAGRYIVYTDTAPWGEFQVGGVNVVTGKRLKNKIDSFRVTGVCDNGVKARNFVKKRADSRLLIVGAILHGETYPNYVERYYVLDGDELKLVYKVTEGLPDPCKPLPKKNG